MECKKVSIILLNWNGLSDTIECLSSLLKSTWENYLVYVVDNGSDGNEGEIIEARFPTVKVLKQKENLGFCKGNNIAIKEVLKDKTGYVLFLNNDTVVPPEMIEKMVTGFECFPDAGAVSPLILDYPDKNNRIQFSGAEWISRSAAFSLVAAGTDYDRLSSQSPYKSGLGCGCCLLTSGTLLSEVGFFDEKYFAYYEDADWCYRLFKKGYQAYVIPEAKVYHLANRSNKVSAVALYLLSRNRLLWIMNNLPLKQKMISLAFVAKEWLWHVLNNFGLIHNNIYSQQDSKAALRGYRDFVCGKFGKWDKKTEIVLFQKRSGA